KERKSEKYEKNQNTYLPGLYLHTPAYFTLSRLISLQWKIK
ncbi:12604_t:CDS:1, partial [Gigaspora rosea]